MGAPLWPPVLSASGRDAHLCLQLSQQDLPLLLPFFSLPCNPVNNLRVCP